MERPPGKITTTCQSLFIIRKGREGSAEAVQRVGRGSEFPPCLSMRKSDAESSEPGSRHRRALRHSRKAGPTAGDQGENGLQKWSLSHYRLPTGCE